MHVEIDNGNAFDAVLQQHSRGNSHIVERTESFAVVGERVMQPTAYMN